MKFLNEYGLVSYESVGSYLSSLRKETWHDLSLVLDRERLEFEAVYPALKFFRKLGTIRIDEDKKNVFVFEEPIDVPQENEHSEQEFAL